jgi:hypothetical protein
VITEISRLIQDRQEQSPLYTKRRQKAPNPMPVGETYTGQVILDMMRQAQRNKEKRETKSSSRFSSS